MRNFIFFLFITLSVTAIGAASERQPSPMIIHGDWETNIDKSLTFPVEVYIDNNQLVLTFLNKTQDVSISIVGSSGTIENRTISFTDFQTEVFDITQYAPGSYCLLITTPRGANFYSNFTVL